MLALTPNLGNLLSELGRKTEAEEQYRLAIEADPKFAPAYSNLGILLYELGRKMEAEEQYRLAIKAAPNLGPAYSNLGNLLYELGRKTEAEEQYRLAIKVDPKFAPAYLILGSLLNELGRKTEAEEQYWLAIKADPKFALAHNIYANLLREKGKFSEADKEVRIALDINPFDPYSLRTYGDILSGEGWLDEAEKEYKSALEHSDGTEDSVKSEIHNNLGLVYAQKKLYEKARDEFSEATRLDPKNVKAIRNLRKALCKIDQPLEITRGQKCIFGFLLLLLLFTIYIFWISKLHETNYSALFIFLIAAMLFVLLYRSIVRFSVGPSGVKFEMSTEHRQAPAKSQEAEALSGFERS
jgi:tetratricopeptide (TPR) repeat protein